MQRFLHSPFRRPWATNSPAPLTRIPLGHLLALPAILFALAFSSSAAEARTLQEKLNQANAYYDEAESLRQALEEIPAGERNLKQYQRVISAYRRVYQTAPTSSKNPKSLLQIGELYRNIGRDLDDKKLFRSAVEAYDFLLKEYPHSQYRAEAMLQSAQIVLEDLKLPEEARKRYQAILDAHPKSPQAKDARAALATRDKGPSEKAETEKASLEKAASDIALREKAGVEKAETSEKSASESAAAPPRSKSEPKPAASAPTASGVRVAVTDVREWRSADTTRVLIDLEGEVKYEVGRLANPPRIFLDLYGTTIGRTVARAIYKKYSSDRDGMVKGLRAAQNTMDVSRIVAEVDGDADYSVFDLTNPYRLVIELHAPRSISKSETKVDPPADTRSDASGVTKSPANTSPSANAATKSKADIKSAAKKSGQDGETASVKSGSKTLETATAEPPEAVLAARETDPETRTPKPSTGAPTKSSDTARSNHAENHQIAAAPKQTAGPVADAAPYGPAKPETTALNQPPEDKAPADKKMDRPVSDSQPSELKPKGVKSSSARTVKPAVEKTGASRVAEKAPGAQQKPDDAPPGEEKSTPSLSADLALPELPGGDSASAQPPKIDDTFANVSDVTKPRSNGKGTKTAKASLAKGKTSPSDPIADNSRTAQPNRDGTRSLTRALGLKIGRIILDPGHGGHDTGTIGPTGLDEKDLVLDVALRLGKLITERLGSEVIYTRQDDTFIPLETRTAIANEKQADLFLSIHANSSPSTRARGIETYYLSFATDPEALEVAARENADSQESIHQLQDLVKKIALHDKVDESKDFAADVQSALHERLSKDNRQRRDRGVKKAPFMVLVGARMPSVLAEIAFLSNPQEEKVLKTKQQRQKIAQALYEGIERYVDTLSGVKVASGENVTEASVK